MISRYAWYLRQLLKKVWVGDQVAREILGPHRPAATVRSVEPAPEVRHLVFRCAERTR